MGHRATDHGGVAALGDDGGAGLGAKFHDIGQFLRVRRANHGGRPALIQLAPILGVGGGVGRLGQKAAISHHGADPVEQGGGVGHG